MSGAREKIFLSPPHMSGEEQKYIDSAFASNWIAPLGPNVEQFEQEIANYVGVRGALSLSSGTAAIHLALRLLNIKPGDLVLCSTFTFVASANPILYEGAQPVFIDSEPDTWNMSPIALKRAIVELSKKGKIPKALILVNLYGQNADMDPLLDICKFYNIPIIEDAAESLGATYKGKMSGTFGKYGIYSFNGNKIITTSGGGMLVSDDIEALERARFWATQSRDQARYYQHSQLGFNYRLSNVLAGIGIAQLKVLEDRICARRAVFKRYFEMLSQIDGVKFMPEADFSFSTRWLTALTIEPNSYRNPIKIIEYLEKKNIEARLVWKPLHLQPLFKGIQYYSHTEEESVSERLFNIGVCLPSGSNLTIEDQNYVINCLKECL
ncbi:DegT/DnrJ/EryC1/StrS family aminotransferase [Paenibacillus filicis]|uniref:DegT/DnrJ/EryC1/StrS family aminotransferase n=1 Tax=Paenibacillus filicis TaxID=669464 RepID=A0ABU9DDP1_9BACL